MHNLNALNPDIIMLSIITTSILCGCFEMRYSLISAETNTRFDGSNSHRCDKFSLVFPSVSSVVDCVSASIDIVTDRQITVNTRATLLHDLDMFS